MQKRPHFEYEKKYLTSGFKYIAGIDEVGRGPWAGPIVAGAVILPTAILMEKIMIEHKILGEINDSKKLSEKKRNELDNIIRDIAIGYGIGEVSSEEIDQIGLQPATFLAFSRAIDKLTNVDFLLIDAIKWNDCKLPYEAIIKGDSISKSIAAASIIAKVYRDNLMCKLHENIPEYRFDLHKGYGTKIHMEALERYGISKHHRKSFAPIKKML